MYSVMNLEYTALRLKALLHVLSSADCGSEEDMVELPIAIGIAADMAEELYCAIVDGKREV